METFSELKFIKNLTWKQVITYSTIFTTSIIGTTWTIATRLADSKAEYVNMRYAELEKLQSELSKTQEELLSYKKNSTLNESNTITSYSENKNNELSVAESFFDTKTNLIISVERISGDQAVLSLNYPNGNNDRTSYIRAGYSSTFENNNKKYQFVVTEIKSEKLKFIIRSI